MWIFRIACLCTSMFAPNIKYLRPTWDPSVRLWLSDYNYTAHQCKTASPSLPATQGTVLYIRSILIRVESGHLQYKKHRTNHLTAFSRLFGNPPCLKSGKHAAAKTLHSQNFRVQQKNDVNISFPLIFHAAFSLCPQTPLSDIHYSFSPLSL